MNKSTMVFVIDDDLDTLETVINFLVVKGYSAKGFANAELAITALEEQPESCQVLITDFMLPNMSGIDLIKNLQLLEVKAPIILMTAYKTAELAATATKAGAYDFITKPIRYSQLQVSVERAVYLNKIRKENTILKSIVVNKEKSMNNGLIGKSPLFLKALDLAKRVANSNSSVLITGESGSGKEIFARLIHQLGKGDKKPFVAINCSAIPENLLESELFGHAKGAFTGAIEKKIGLFEEAEGGTLFLDEIGDMSLALQAKVLRAIQERKIKRVGENQMRDIDIRIISATHKNFKQEIANKNFREDLFYRLNVIPIHVPSLRERTEDILLLADFFMNKYSLINNCKITGISSEAKELLLKNNWCGNVRELENTIERAVVLCRGNQITEVDILQQDFEATHEPKSSVIKEDDFYIPRLPLLSLEEVSIRYMRFALMSNLGAKDQTARDLKINRKTLYLHLKEKQSKEELTQFS